MAQIPAASLQYQLQHIHESRQSEIVIVNCIGLFLATLAVGCRFLSRKISRLPFEADDYTILGALVLGYGLFTSAICSVFLGGMGKHQITSSEAKAVAFLKSVYAVNLIYTNLYPLIKISILLLYRRLFPLPDFKRFLHVFIGALTCFQIATTLVDIFNCTPIQASWNKSLPNSKCINPPSLYLSTAIINLLVDVIILILPMPLVWHLKISLKQKIGVSMIFVVGSLTCITTVFRILNFRSLSIYDLTWSYIDTAYWIFAEVIGSFVCACLPTFAPLFRSVSAKIRSSIPKSFSGHKSSSAGESSKTPPTMPTLKSWHSAGESEKPTPMEKPGGILERDLFDDNVEYIQPVESEDTAVDEGRGMTVADSDGICKRCLGRAV